MDGEGAGAWYSLRAWPNVSSTNIHSSENLPLHNMACAAGEMCGRVASTTETAVLATLRQVTSSHG